MGIIQFAVFTADERAAVVALNANGFNIDPRLIDAAAPGVGVNLNPSATNYAAGAVVDLAGKYVSNWRLVNDPDYQANNPAMVAFQASLPSCQLETETIFLPQPESV